MNLLKQSTAATVRIGPFVDATDGVTPETGITLGAADQAELLKHTGATVDISGATWAAITGCGGYYDLSLTTSHTDTLGMLTVVVQDSSVCVPAPAFRAMVVPAAIYDSLVGGTDTLPADVTQWNGTAVATPDTAGFPKVTIKSGTGTGEISLTSGRVLTRGAIVKNTALANFPFSMTDSTNHNPATGLTVTATRSIDGGAYASGTITNMTEIGNGSYQCDLGAGDLNGDTIIFRFTASGADDLTITVVPVP